MLPVAYAESTPPSRLCGRYSRLALLNRGGMGEVWKAYDHKHQEEVVVKHLPEPLRSSPDEVEQLRASFRMVKMLRHPNICTIYDYDEDESVGLFLVMKFVEGINLAQAQQRRKAEPYSVLECCQLLYPIAEALDHAHAEKIVHRDVKPSNIMLPNDHRGAQLVDFGIAASVDAYMGEQLNSAAVSGTKGYMAPEVLHKQGARPQSDQYSLAVVAYELIGGHSPFVIAPGESLSPMSQWEMVPALSVSSAVNQVLRRGLAQRPEDRFEKCTDFIETLRSENSAYLLGSGEKVVRAGQRIQPRIRQSLIRQSLIGSGRRCATQLTAARSTSLQVARKLRSTITSLLPLAVLLVLLTAVAHSLKFTPQTIAYEGVSSEPVDAVITEAVNTEAVTTDAVTTQKTDKLPMAQAYEAKGVACMEQGQMREAIENLQYVVALMPERTQAWALLGTAHRQNGQNAEALAAFDRAHALDPADLSTRQMRGQVHQALGNYSQAIVDFDRYLDKQFQNVDCLEARGVCYLHLSRPALAIVDFQDALRIDSKRLYLEAWIRSCQVRINGVAQLTR